jgi:methyl-accepting chemotaxis protein
MQAVMDIPAGDTLMPADDNGQLSLPPVDDLNALRGQLAALARGEWPALLDADLIPLVARLQSAEAGRTLTQQVLRQLAACNLDLGEVPEDAEPVLAAGFKTGFGNLSEAIRQARGFAVAIAKETPQIAEKNQALSVQSQRQADAVTKLGERATNLISALAEAGKQLQELGRLAAEADQRATSGRAAAATLGSVMKDVRDRATSITGVIEVIDSVAFQTNILSINAAIEAARAGDAGRSFSVVAKEIRMLASRAATAAKDVRALIGETQDAVKQGAQTAEATSVELHELGSLAERTSKAMASVSESMTMQSHEAQAIEVSLVEVANLSQSNLAHAEEIREGTKVLSTQSEMLGDCVKLFQLPENPLSEPAHAEALDVAQWAAQEIGRVLEEAVAQGDISEDDLFARDYSPIANTDPLKHNAIFTPLCDEVLPAIQESVLDENPWAVFAITANIDGYVPTHNRKFSQPLTGNREKDLAGNRARRIFSDRVGRTVGAHTDPYRLQIYRRDTGEIMFDISVPIYFGERHWGGFRIGYRLG